MVLSEGRKLKLNKSIAGYSNEEIYLTLLELVKELSEETFLVDAEMYVEEFFERLNVGDVPEDVPAKMSGWLFAKCESIPKVGFEMEYLATYTMFNEETENYDDYAKMLTISIAEVQDRRITKIKVVLRDATEEEIEQQKELED